MRVCAIIPARYGSTRLPQKALLPLNGTPMIAHVMKNAAASKYISDVYVATDHAEIAGIVEAHGGTAVMTSEACPSGTDRIVEALGKLEQTYDIVVNIQGDEPLLTAELIDKAIDALIENNAAQVATLASSALSEEDYTNPNRVKVISNLRSEAIYFSRAAIPHQRDAIGLPPQAKLHIGLYVFRREFLEAFAAMPPSGLENIEKLEQLRIIDNGYTIAVAETSQKPLGIDVQADIAMVEKRLTEDLH